MKFRAVCKTNKTTHKIYNFLGNHAHKCSGVLADFQLRFEVAYFATRPETDVLDTVAELYENMRTFPQVLVFSLPESGFSSFPFFKL